MVQFSPVKKGSSYFVSQMQKNDAGEDVQGLQHKHKCRRVRQSQAAIIQVIDDLIPHKTRSQLNVQVVDCRSLSNKSASKCTSFCFLS